MMRTILESNDAGAAVATECNRSFVVGAVVAMMPAAILIAGVAIPRHGASGNNSVDQVNDRGVEVLYSESGGALADAWAAPVYALYARVVVNRAGECDVDWATASGDHHTVGLKPLV